MGWQDAPVVGPEEAPQAAAGWQSAPVDEGALAAGARGAGDSLTFGFSDEILAGLKTGFGFGGDYSKQLEAERKALADAQAAHPLAYGVGQVAGVAPTLLLPGGAVARGASFGTRLATGAKVGAATGAAYGAGSADGDLVDRAKGGLIGGAVGGLTGAGGTAAVAGATNLVKSGVGMVRGALNPADEAASRIAAAGQRDAQVGSAGLNAGQVDDAITRGQPVAVMDAGGETTRALAQSAANTSPEGRAVVERTIQDRFEEQGDRATGFIRKLVGGTDATTKRDSLQSAAKAANGPAYRAAYASASNEITSPELARFETSPAVQAAMKAAAAKGGNRAVAEGLPALKPGVKNLQFWDYTRRELSDAAAEAGRAGRKGEADTLGAIAKAVNAELDAIAPAYKTARAGAASFFDAEDALEAGQRFVTSNKPLAEAEKVIRKMSAPEKALFEEGFASDLIDKISKVSDRRNVINQIFGNANARKKVEMAMGPQKAKELEAFVHAEEIMDQARKAVTGNSTTARQLAEIGIAGGLTSGGYGLASGDVSASGLAIAAFTGGLIRKGIDRRIAKSVAEQLASTDPAKVRMAVYRIANAPKLLNAVRVLELPGAAYAGQRGAEGGNALLGQP